MMLRTLLESQARPARRVGGTVVSAVTHTTIIGAAIAATANATSTTGSPTIADPPIVLQPVVMPTAPDHSTRSTGSRESLNDVFRPPVITEVPFPRTFIADNFPPAVFGRITDARDFTSTRVGDSSAFGTRSGGAFGSPMESGIFTTATVDRAAAPRADNPAPVYPASLRSASLEGSVVARFVVDTTGRAEPRSIGFPEATHPLFAEAVRQALLRSRYIPATIAGRPVRQLVEQRFAFTLTR